MLPFIPAIPKKNKSTNSDPEEVPKPVPFYNASYDPQSNLVHVEAAFDPQYLQNVLGSLMEATGSGGPVAPLYFKAADTPQPAPAPSGNPGMADKKYDVFMSYASADRKYVRQLVNQLKRQHIRVWFDQDEIHAGDPHRVRIDQGINRSRFIMVVLSPCYIQDERYWTHAEVNAAIQTESVFSTHIIPLQHHLTQQEIHEYSPMLASRTVIDTTACSTAKIARRVRYMLDHDAA